MTIEITQITKSGVINFFHRTQAILEGPLITQATTRMIPTTSAAVPKMTCDHTVTEPNIESSKSSSASDAKLGTITIKIKTVCKIKAATVE
ncbi:MAG: hypothetical protein M1540_07220 [Candidatus Bathyarchaeota archaeon]|nr:hypothetical protein [Candidatus Bathyarchaeota archaeon]